MSKFESILLISPATRIYAPQEFVEKFRENKYRETFSYEEVEPDTEEWEYLQKILETLELGPDQDDPYGAYWECWGELMDRYQMLGQDGIWYEIRQVEKDVWAVPFVYSVELMNLPLEDIISYMLAWRTVEVCDDFDDYLYIDRYGMYLSTGYGGVLRANMLVNRGTSKNPKCQPYQLTYKPIRDLASSQKEEIWAWEIVDCLKGNIKFVQNTLSIAEFLEDFYDRNCVCKSKEKLDNFLLEVYDGKA